MAPPAEPDPGSLDDLEEMSGYFRWTPEFKLGLETDEDWEVEELWKLPSRSGRSQAILGHNHRTGEYRVHARIREGEGWGEWCIFPLTSDTIARVLPPSDETS